VISVEITIKEGPIFIPTLGGSGVHSTHDLWEEISASEFFPPNTDSAFYVVSLIKPVGDPSQVLRAEAELISALHLLSFAWPFCGGSFMVLQQEELITSPKFQSNALAVREQLLAECGKEWIEASYSFPIVATATYRLAPLKRAAIIAIEATKNPGLRRLLRYHQMAWVEYHQGEQSDPSSWFIDLYKVCEFLQKYYKGERVAQSTLDIPQPDWRFFRAILNNNDLRHAEISALVPPVPREDIDRLYRLALTWTARHLKKLGLPVLDEICDGST
jgi:hypothetical protein